MLPLLVMLCVYFDKLQGHSDAAPCDSRDDKRRRRHRAGTRARAVPSLRDCGRDRSDAGPTDGDCTPSGAVGAHLAAVPREVFLRRDRRRPHAVARRRLGPNERRPDTRARPRGGGEALQWVILCSFVHSSPALLLLSFRGSSLMFAHILQAPRRPQATSRSHGWRSRSGRRGSRRRRTRTMSRRLC